MEKYTEGKYACLLKELLSHKDLIKLAQKFGLKSNNDSYQKYDIVYGEDCVCVYEKLYSTLGDEITTSVVFNDFSVHSSSVFEGTRVYANAQKKYRNIMQSLLSNTHPEYMEDFAQYLLDEERKISQKYEAKKQEERIALENELGLNGNNSEETLER